jgi:type I site-specific restriction endonuclease
MSAKPKSGSGVPPLNQKQQKKKKKKRDASATLAHTSQGTTLSTVADQSARYAASLPDFLAAGLSGTLPFLYESTGVEGYFRDERDPAPRSCQVFTFHRPETLAALAALLNRHENTNTRRPVRSYFSHRPRSGS